VTAVGPTASLTRARVLELLEQGEFAGTSVLEDENRLAKGQEYLDLERLDAGVQRASDSVTALRHVLPRKAVHEDTWRKLLRQLSAP
jgi:hypothetical protein